MCRMTHAPPSVRFTSLFFSGMPSAPKKNPKVRGWLFTLNNYTEQEEKHVQSIDAIYLVYGREVGEQGTPHLQGYVYFKNAKTMSAAKRLISSRAHLDKPRGTPQQCCDYCMKDGDVFEKGDRPMSQSDKGVKGREYWESVWDAAKAKELESIDPYVRIHSYRNIKQIGVDYQAKPPSLSAPCGFWIHGEPGSGKTTLARRMFPNAYIKQRNQWWDGYQGEDAVIMDDMDPYSKALGGLIKDWTDQHPFRCGTKGSTLFIRPKYFVITSQYTPEEVWEDAQTSTAIRDRCKVIHYSRSVSRRAALDRENPFSDENVEEMEAKITAELDALRDQEQGQLYEDSIPVPDDDSVPALDYDSDGSTQPLELD